MYNKYSITVLSFFFLILLFPFLGIFSKLNYNVEEIKEEREFTSDSSSLGSVQMRDFLLWSKNKKGNLKHTIVDRAGSISVTNWKV